MDAAQLRPLRVGEALDVAIKIYRQRFGALVRAAAAIVIPVAVLSGLLQISARSLDFTSSTAANPPEIRGGDVAASLVALLATLVLTFVGSQLASAASFKIVSGEYLDEPADWRSSLRVAGDRLGSLLWLAFLFVVFLALGALACVVPAIYLYGAWSVAIPVLLLEDVRGRHALKRSRQLVKGRWWPVAAVLLLSAVLTGIFQAIVGGVVLAVVAVAGNDTVDVVARVISQAAAQVVLTPFTATVITVLYFDLRVRKEGFDLELLARRLGTQSLPPVTDA